MARILTESKPEELQLTHVVNRAVARKRVDWAPGVEWSEDFDAVLASDVDVVVELVGGLDPADFRIHGGAFVGHGIAGPAGTAVAAGRHRAGPGIEPDHAIGNRRQRVAAVLGVRHRRRNRGDRAEAENHRYGGDGGGKFRGRYRCHHRMAPP